MEHTFLMGSWTCCQCLNTYEGPAAFGSMTPGDWTQPICRACYNTTRLSLVPCTLEEANAFVREHHRHHKPVPGAKFCVAVAEMVEPRRPTECSGVDLKIVGVAIVGRPIARMIDDGWTLEVNRSCTDGTPNVNSMLYGAARRAAWALGYKRLVTYTLPEEGGASLRAAGFREIGSTGESSGWAIRECSMDAAVGAESGAGPSCLAPSDYQPPYLLTEPTNVIAVVTSVAALAMSLGIAWTAWRWAGLGAVGGFVSAVYFAMRLAERFRDR